MPDRRAAVIALALLAAVLAAATAVCMRIGIDLTDQINSSPGFTGEDDPALREYQARWAASAVLTLVTPALGLAAAVALPVLAGTLAWRWQRREARAQDEATAAS